MKNLFKNTEFVFGVTSYRSLPKDVGSEVLLAGRSNAGKSSALNVLTDNPKLASLFLLILDYQSVHLER